MMSTEILKQKIIQRAWEDNSFKELLLSNPKAALKEFGVTLPDNVGLKAMEETDTEFVLVIPTNPAKVLVASNGSEAQW
ncbi:Nitrile hydratase, alpha chain [compost metagenome]